MPRVRKAVPCSAIGLSTFRPAIRSCSGSKHLKWKENPERGCPSATLRVWPWNERNRTPLELCGDSLEQHSKITSETNLMRVSFFVADKAVGAKGFKAIWTEIKDTSNCQEFQCTQVQF